MNGRTEDRPLRAVNVGRPLPSGRMASRISHTTFDCTDAHALSEWWKQILDYTDVPCHANQPGHEECMILDPSTGRRLLFIEVPDVKRVKNRAHLDLVPVDRTRDAEVERALALGATISADRRHADGTGWAVLADPQGNEFCILRSDQERATSS
jgi:hypothetical protein